MSNVGRYNKFTVPSGREFKLGVVSYLTTHRAVGGHDGAYTMALTIDQQIAIKKRLNVRAVRSEVNVTKEGSLNNPQYGNMETRTLNVFRRYNTEGWTNVVLLMDRLNRNGYNGNNTGFDNGVMDDDTRDINFTGVTETPEEMYQRAYVEAYDTTTKFLTNYSADMPVGNTIFELGNEPCLFRHLIKPGTNGVYNSNYWPHKTNVFINYTNGAFDAIRDFNSSYKISTPGSFGWLPIDLYDRLTQARTYDYLAWHWYSDHEENMNRGDFILGSQYKDITTYLTDRYNLDIIFTETNGRARSNLYPEEGSDAQENRTLEYYDNFLTKCLANPRVKMVLTYTMLDDVHVKTTDEQRLGMIWFPLLDKSLPPAQQNFQVYKEKKQCAIFRAIKYL